MYLWDTHSLISRINRNDTTAIPDVHFRFVFDAAMEISVNTGGAYDVTIVPLVNAWNMDTIDPPSWPDSVRVDSLLEFTGYQKVWIQHHHLVKKDPRLQLDFNAIAQGYTVDLIADFFRSNGIDDFLVEIGGEVRANGVNQQGKVWQIGIDQPQDSLTAERPLQTTVALQNKALATSGSYRKYQLRNGKKLSHVIDPVTGYPMQQNLISVSVLADDCTTADGYATAFLVMGMQEAMALAQQKNLEIFCIYEDVAGQLRVNATPGFSKE
jgi:thiamine biosynthesis lipoprotein